MTNEKQIRVTRREVKRLRRAQGWSAARLGVEIGEGLPGLQYSRSYIKSIEGGSLPVSQKFAARFALLRARLAGEQRQHKNILLRGALPKRLVIAGKVKRCAACGWHFVGASANQKYCGDDCRQHARRKDAKPQSRKSVKQ